MKRIIALLLILALTLSILGGCSSGKNSDNNNGVESENATGDQEHDTIEVDKKLMSVEVTIPALLLSMDDEDIDYEEIINNAKEEEGFEDAVKNDDGSITYKISKAKHKEMMDQLSDDIHKSFEEIIDDEDVESIKGITSNKKFSEIEVIVDKEKFENSLDSLSIFGIAIQSMFYQLYDGVSPDKYKVAIKLIDEATQEVFDTIIYPDALEQ